MRRRPILGLLCILLLLLVWHLLSAFTLRMGECKPKPVDPEARYLTRDERGVLVSYPARIDFPPQTRPLTVLTYNISGHNELYDSKHIAKIAAVINEAHPDIVGLQEVHRHTWQSRWRDQMQELEAATHMHGYFGPALTQWGGQFGDAVLTRGEIVSATTHALPSVGEPRILVESIIRIDGATIDFYVTHLITWGKYESNARNQQLHCLARMVRTSRYPYILTGDFNAPLESTEVKEFRHQNAAQICGEDIGISHPLMKERIDYVWADYGWNVSSAKVLKVGPSDHYPVVAELEWNR
jgi:endonuclease/exonuclease/phosphatase family metal-dependent hydrolase